MAQVIPSSPNLAVIPAFHFPVISTNPGCSGARVTRSAVVQSLLSVAYAESTSQHHHQSPTNIALGSNSLFHIRKLVFKSVINNFFLFW